MKKFRLICVANLGRKRRTKESEREGERESVGEGTVCDNASLASCRQHENSIFMREFWWMLPNENMKRFARLSVPLSFSCCPTHARTFAAFYAPQSFPCVCVFGINFWQSSYFRQPVVGHALSIPLPLTHFHFDSLSLSLSLLTCGSPKCRLHINLFSLLMFRPLWQSCLDNWSNLMKRARRALFEHYIW